MDWDGPEGGMIIGRGGPENSVIIEKKASGLLNQSNIWARVPKGNGVLGSLWRLTLELASPSCFGSTCGSWKEGSCVDI